mgnify:CR=1
MTARSRYYARSTKSALADKIETLLEQLRALEASSGVDLAVPRPCWERSPATPHAHLKAVYKRRVDHTASLVAYAIRECRRLGEPITLRRLEAISRQNDPHGKGVGRRAIVGNEKARALYAAASGRGIAPGVDRRRALELVSKEQLVGQLLSLIESQASGLAQLSARGASEWKDWVQSKGLKSFVDTYS